MGSEPMKIGPFTIPIDEGCTLCWLVDRIERGGGSLEIGLCYALHTGAAATSGAQIPICDRHQELVDRTGRDFMEAMHAVDREAAPAVPSPPEGS